MFVLHCFQKKSKGGIVTPKHDMDIIRARLKVAEARAKELRHGIEIEASSGNVFADLGLPDADKLKIKSGLVIEITGALRRLGLRACREIIAPSPKVLYDACAPLRRAQTPLGLRAC